MTAFDCDTLNKNEPKHLHQYKYTLMHMHEGGEGFFLIFVFCLFVFLENTPLH